MLKSVALIIGVVFACAAHSQDSKNPRAKPRVTQNQPGTEQSPLVVKGIPADKPKDETDREIEKIQIDRDMRDFGRTSTRITRLLLLIAAAQAGMFWWQLRLMKSSAKTAADAAGAALKQAQAIQRSERAYVKMSHVESIHIKPGQNWGEIKIETRNYGKTPATVTDVVVDAALLPVGEELPRPFPSRDKEREAIPQAFLAAQDVFYTSKVIPLRGEDREAIGLGAKTLWVFGHVDYIDAFDGRYRGEYVRVYQTLLDDGKTSNTLVFPYKGRYNTDRPRQKGEGNDWDETA